MGMGMKRDVLQPPKISYALLAMEILGLKIGVGGVGVWGRGTRSSSRPRGPETREPQKWVVSQS